MITPSKEAVIDIFNYYIEQNNMYLMTQEEHKRYLEKDKEIERLNNIINEIEEYMKKEWDNKNYGSEYKIALSKVYNILQE